MIVKAKAIKEIYKGNNDFRVIAFSPIGKFDELELSKNFTFTCSGSNFPYISESKEYEIEIEKDNNSKYEASYKIISCPSLDKLDFNNLSKEESFEIMMDITSSPRIADNILCAYPNFLEIILTKGKDAIDTNLISGVGSAYLTAYERNINEKYKYYHILKKYNMYKIDVIDCKNLFSKYGDENKIEKEINSNPYYVLIEVLGKTFNQTDRMIIENREDLIDSDIRCEALIMHILRRNENDGSTRIHGNAVYYYMKNEYNVPELLKIMKDVCINSALIYYDKETSNLSLMSTWIAENKVADFINTKIKDSVELDIDWKQYKQVDDFELTDLQLGALETFCKYNLSIIAGYSGSGKSASVKNLVRLIEDNGMSYVLLSSTGKASKVLSESTGRRATTIHKRCYQGEIDCDVIIIDEFGMVALDTMMMLINSIINEDCRIVFVGDPSQISAIGLSKIFDDMINSKIVPMTMLTEIFRYKSNGSLFVATNVRNGKSFFNDKEMVKHHGNELSISSNYRFIQCEDEDILDNVVKEYKNLLSKGIKKDEIMVLSPFNVKSVGTYAINSAIQAEVNPPKPNEKYLTREIGNVIITFRLNDVVINTKNDYKAIGYDEYKEMIMSDGLIKPDDLGKYVIVNGQTGTIRQILDDGLVVQFEEDLIWVSKFKLNNLLLSYSISGHKSQGSSIDYTIGIVSPQHQKMLSRGLLYVCDTRCRKAHIDIGSIEAFENALQVVDNDLRDTWLLYLLTKGSITTLNNQTSTTYH